MYLPLVFETTVVPSRKRPIIDLADIIEDVLPLKTRRLSSASKNDSNLFAKVNVEGFSREELKVSVDGKELIIEGKHSESDEKVGTLERTFTRKIPIPDEIKQETFKSDLSDDGKYLLIRANRKEPEKPKRITIPIGIKNSSSSTSPSPTPTPSEHKNGDEAVKNGCNCNTEKENVIEKNGESKNNTSDLSNTKFHEVIID
uniref:SHSP domain-containing protein n=1 Tax=Panagrolaimus sp. PS1159 TaxID=55785 RepID=A0AC35GQZ7_9BILA